MHVECSNSENDAKLTQFGTNLEQCATSKEE